MYHHHVKLILLALGGLLLIGGASCLSQQSRHLCGINELSTASLRLSPGSEVVFPGDDDFGAVTLRWTNFSRPTYSVAVIPALESDVQKLARFATACDIPFLATSGAHGFDTTLGRVKQGLEIDLSRFRAVSIDATANTLIVGGGVRFSDMIDAVYAAGKEISPLTTSPEQDHGTGPCVGMLSPTLAGGVGRYSGLHGMISDQLLSARVVTANGSVVTASATEHSDLFWALRGAGNNFGIVTEATYRVFNLTSRIIVNADYAFSPNASAAIIDYFASFGDNTPPKLALILFGKYDANTKDVSNMHTISATHPSPTHLSCKRGTQLSLWVNIVYAGRLVELQPLLDPLLAKVTPYRQNVSEIPWSQMLYYNFFGATPSAPAACAAKGLDRDIYGGAIKSYDKREWNRFIANFSSFLRGADEASRSSIFFIEQFSKVKVLQIPDEETAYPWRDITAHLYIYVNYGHGDEKSEVLYSARKLPRLRALKKIWDPENAFRFAHPFV
ncbi:putative FAD-dependent oxidase [Apodospora peruviana]|uniref:FAD-dependent oxidase n=1 Tax=Apodospora peruviana TaxID=516989 RepID=A0AAE0HS46_9PEZI|nr:putative FAD-dependent oxidase [Apodospora peruviana]